MKTILNSFLKLPLWVHFTAAAAALVGGGFFLINPEKPVPHRSQIEIAEKAQNTLLWVVDRHSNPATPPPSEYEPSIGRLGIVSGQSTSQANDGRVAIRQVYKHTNTELHRGLCEGALLDDGSRQWVLTAAHCVEDQHLRLEIFGSDWQAIAYEAWSHAGYEGAGSPADIALIRLNTPAPDNAATATLATQSEIERLRPGETLIAAGRGTTRTDERGPTDPTPELKQAQVKLVSAGPFFIRVKWGDGIPCIGDSGGFLAAPARPNVILGTLSGVLPQPNGQICQAGSQAQYVNAATLQGWINGIVSKFSEG